MTLHARLAPQDGWFDTGITLATRDLPCTLEVRGRLWGWPDSDPNGKNNTRGTVIPGLPQGMVLGRINGTVFPIGRGGLVPPSVLKAGAQRLELSLNGAPAGQVAGPIVIRASPNHATSMTLTDGRLKWERRMQAPPTGLLCIVETLRPRVGAASLSAQGMWLRITAQGMITAGVGLGSTTTQLLGALPPCQRTEIFVGWTGGSGWDAQGRFDLQINGETVASATGVRPNRQGRLDWITVDASQLWLHHASFQNGDAQAFLDALRAGRVPTNTQGVHAWPQFHTRANAPRPAVDLAEPPIARLQGNSFAAIPSTPAPGDSLTRKVMAHRDAVLAGALNQRDQALKDARIQSAGQIHDAGRGAVTGFGGFHQRGSLLARPIDGNDGRWSPSWSMQDQSVAGRAWGVDHLTGDVYAIANRAGDRSRFELWRFSRGDGWSKRHLDRTFQGLDKEPAGHRFQFGTNLIIDRSRGFMHMVTTTDFAAKPSGDRKFLFWRRALDDDWWMKQWEWSTAHTPTEPRLGFDPESNWVWLEYGDRLVGKDAGNTYYQAYRSGRDFHMQPERERMVYLNTTTGCLESVRLRGQTNDIPTVLSPKIEGVCRVVAVVDDEFLLACQPGNPSAPASWDALSGDNARVVWRAWGPKRGVREGSRTDGGIFRFIDLTTIATVLGKPNSTIFQVRSYDPRQALALSAKALVRRTATALAEAHEKKADIQAAYNPRIRAQRDLLHKAHVRHQSLITSAQIQAKTLVAPGNKGLVAATTQRTTGVRTKWKTEHTRVDNAFTSGNAIKDAAVSAAMSKLQPLIKVAGHFFVMSQSPDKAAGPPKRRFEGTYAHELNNILDDTQKHKKTK